MREDNSYLYIFGICFIIIGSVIICFNFYLLGIIFIFGGITLFLILLYRKFKKKILRKMEKNKK